jgi:hypothetical protein
MRPTTSFRLTTALLALAVTTACADTSTGVARLSPSADLDAPTLSAVRSALQDEYHASAVYTAVMNQFGPVMPFVNIERAERQHASSLAALLLARGLPIPAAEPLSVVPTFSSASAACAAAAEAEVSNIALYDRLLTGTAPSDVRRVFENNRRASVDNHLPAFEHCR